MQQPTVDSERTADLSGLRCPHLLLAVIDLVRALEAEFAHSRAAPPTLRILATDLNAPSSITAWTRQSGCELIEMYDEDGTFVFRLRCRNHTYATVASAPSTRTQT